MNRLPGTPVIVTPNCRDGKENASTKEKSDVKRMIVFAFALVCLTLVGPQTCAAAGPQRVAILPVAATVQARESPAVEATVARTMFAWFHTPLPSFVKVYDMIPPAEVKAALLATGTIDPRRPDPARLREIAARLEADVVLGAVITDLGEYTTTNRMGDLILQTDLAIRLIGYRRDTQRFIDIRDREDYHEAWTADGQAVSLAPVLTERLMKKAVGDRSFPLR